MLLGHPSVSPTFLVLKYWQQYDGLNLSDDELGRLCLTLSSPETILRTARHVKQDYRKNNMDQIKKGLMRWKDNGKR